MTLLRLILSELQHQGSSLKAPVAYREVLKWLASRWEQGYSFVPAVWDKGRQKPLSLF